MDNENVLTNLQTAAVEYEYAYADFEAWRETGRDNAEEINEIRHISARALNLLRVADGIIRELSHRKRESNAPSPATSHA